MRDDPASQPALEPLDELLVTGPIEEPTCDDDEDARELVLLVRAAHAPSAIAFDRHESLLARALERAELGELDETERAAAEQLRLALDGEEHHELGSLARELAMASRPSDLPPNRNAELVANALRDSGGRSADVVPFGPRRRAPPSRVPWTWGALAGALAAAAAVVVLVSGRSAPSSGPPPPNLVASRSTKDLFGEPFAAQGGESSRADRIADARHAELRANRFARWGVK